MQPQNLHENLHEQLHNLATLHQLCEALYREPNLASHHSGTSRHGNARLTPQEQWLNVREYMSEQWARIETIAAELSWRGQSKDGDPARFIANRLSWAEQNYPYMTDLAETTQEVHGYFQTLARENDEITQHLCPMCGGTQLRHRERDQQYYCTECDGAWTTETLATLRTYRITTAGEWLTAKEAATRYGITRDRIYQWKARGQIHPDNARRVNTAEIENLL